MDEPTVDFLIALETGVWEALVRGDASADRALLARDFLGVYPTGFAGREDHARQLESGPSVDCYAIVDARVVDISGTAKLLSYRADYRRAGAGPGSTESMYVSSLWTAIDGRWLNVFSQDTPVE
jgi:hypothetical protein